MYVVIDSNNETVALCSREEDAIAYGYSDDEPTRYYEWMLWKSKQEKD